jgi:hypothetical protein
MDNHEFQALANRLNILYADKKRLSKMLDIINVEIDNILDDLTPVMLENGLTEVATPDGKFKVSQTTKAMVADTFTFVNAAVESGRLDWLDVRVRVSALKDGSQPPGVATAMVSSVKFTPKG